MGLEIPPTRKWLLPWKPLTDSGQPFVVELRKEVGQQHVLFGVSVEAIARHVGSDDVLFATGDSRHPLAVVHLTWAARRESSDAWPYTTLYRDWQDWIDNRMLADHQDYSVNDEGEG